MGGGSAVVKESGKDASRLKFVGSNPWPLSTLEEGVGSVQTCNAESESVCDIAQWFIDELLLSESDSQRGAPSPAHELVEAEQCWSHLKGFG